MPSTQCRVTDDLLTKAYDAAARMGRIGNSLSHLMLALSASLQQEALGASSTSLSDASLQAFALMSPDVHSRPDSSPGLAGTVTLIRGM